MNPLFEVLDRNTDIAEKVYKHIKFTSMIILCIFSTGIVSGAQIRHKWPEEVMDFTYVVTCMVLTFSFFYIYMPWQKE